MARPLSDDKRAALLEAAAAVVAELGVGAPTAKIARVAGVAEGTLFTYFATKDELLNRLYLELKTGLRDAVMDGFPSGRSLDERARYFWARYIGWGAAYPLRRRAMRQLAVSDRITEATREQAGCAFGEFHSLMRECAAAGPLRDLPPAFATAVMTAIADVTLEFIAREPGEAERYTEAGFATYWNAVAG